VLALQHPQRIAERVLRTHSHHLRGGSEGAGRDGSQQGLCRCAGHEYASTHAMQTSPAASMHGMMAACGRREGGGRMKWGRVTLGCHQPAINTQLGASTAHATRHGPYRTHTPRSDSMFTIISGPGVSYPPLGAVRMTGGVCGKGGGGGALPCDASNQTCPVGRCNGCDCDGRPPTPPHPTQIAYITSARSPPRGAVSQGVRGASGGRAQTCIWEANGTGSGEDLSKTEARLPWRQKAKGRKFTTLPRQ
jgi:hypothetical protein